MSVAPGRKLAPARARSGTKQANRNTSREDWRGRGVNAGRRASEGSGPWIGSSVRRSYERVGVSCPGQRRSRRSGVGLPLVRQLPDALLLQEGGAVDIFAAVPVDAGEINDRVRARPLLPVDADARQRVVPGEQRAIVLHRVAHRRPGAAKPGVQPLVYGVEALVVAGGDDRLGRPSGRVVRRARPGGEHRRRQQRRRYGDRGHRNVAHRKPRFVRPRSRRSLATTEWAYRMNLVRSAFLASSPTRVRTSPAVMVTASPERSEAEKLISSTSFSITVCRRRAPMFSIPALISAASVAISSMASEVKSRLTSS